MLGSLPANCVEITLPERSRAEIVFPCAPAAPGTETRKTRRRGSNCRSFDVWLMVETAKLLPALFPTKKVEPADVPPLFAGLATVTMDVPAEATSAWLMVAC